MPKCCRTLFSYTTTVLAIESLSSTLIERMTQLYLDNYEGSSKTLFTGDLSKRTRLSCCLQMVTLSDSLPFSNMYRQLMGAHSGWSIPETRSSTKEHWGQ